MRIQVLVEQVKGNGYRATGAKPLALSAKGATRDEELAKLRANIESQLSRGGELVALDIGQPPHPWMEFAGMFKDDPWIDDWVSSMSEHRKAVENDPDR